mgnify:CR=1 FL=1
MSVCRDCGNSRRNSENGVYCRLLGIMIRAGHDGCKYHTDLMERANAETCEHEPETGVDGRE